MPISLTFICSKIIETIIKDQLMYYLMNNKLISRHQHGFHSRHSTCTQLLECINEWSIALNENKSVDVLNLDYSHAFDSVIHRKLLAKLKMYEIYDALLSWISAFLTGRSQSVVLGDKLSS